jgi:endonuclease G
MRHGSAFRAVLVPALFFLPCVLAAAPLPDAVRGDLSLEKTSLTISYNPEHKQANWVFYPLSRNELRNCVQRDNRFFPDPELNERDSAALEDFRHSGFHRGHLSPAADNKWSAQAMRESFLLSNVSPQPPRFNMGIWGKLETLVRAWALKQGGLWVTTGPILKDGLETIGDNEVSVPEAFYKVLVSQKTRKALAFLLPATATGDLAAYAVPIRMVEEETNLNFHQGLDSIAEEEAEAGLDLRGWDFRASYKAPPCRPQFASPSLPIDLSALFLPMP